MEYKKPPIVEAVIDLRFAEPVGEDQISRAAIKIKNKYKHDETEKNVEVKIEEKVEVPTVQTSWSGRKFSSSDRTEIALLRTSSFISASLAPYPGWKAFAGRARRDWDDWRAAAGHTRLGRIGVRYVNRIDVPSTEADAVAIGDYLNVVPSYPPQIRSSPMLGYAMQVVLPKDDSHVGVVLNAATVLPSPLIGYVSFVLDIDVSREHDLPLREDSLWQVVEELRAQKNYIFETCITDKSRELFR